WKVSRRLTLNLGLRYELEMATTDSENRNVRGFDPTASISIAGTAKAAYAANPIAQLPVSAFNPQGGLLFATDANKGFWNTDKNNVQPRVGFAYQLNEKTVVRGGVGVYTVPFIITGNVQHGFSQNTGLIATNDLGLTFVGTLANPYPNGILQPVGASKGADTFLGQSIGRFAPLNLKNPQNTRYTIGVQRELPGQWLLDLAYTGSHGWDQTADLDLNPTPAQFLSTSPVRDQATID